MGEHPSGMLLICQVSSRIEFPKSCPLLDSLTWLDGEEIRGKCLQKKACVAYLSVANLDESTRHVHEQPNRKVKSNPTGKSSFGSGQVSMEATLRSHQSLFFAAGMSPPTRNCFPFDILCGDARHAGTIRSAVEATADSQ
ncbi:hypothetical protein AVEN_93514-1 [Araneus ventricosus]|uniref:Uncharacterized protein n=1 Tax=Araneus ventricosus TaxID=182803 RepID=A0A4Y2ARX3_ARAVE|nr:hypothetical protein AVEN_93514-1 [Araneus ventricosus]